MQITIWNQSGNNDNQYLACPLVSKILFISQVLDFLRGRCRELMECHKVLRCACESSIVLPSSYLSIYWRQLHQKKNVPFSVSTSRIIVGLIDELPCLCPHGSKIFSSGWMSLGTFRPIPRWSPDHYRHCPCWHRYQNWKHQYSSHGLFANGSRVSLYNYNWRAVRYVRHLVERLVDCCIQETDGIRRDDDQSGRGWPWTHHQIPHKTSADGSRFGSWLTTCSGGNDGQDSVRTIGLDVMFWAITRTIPTKTWPPFRPINPTLILDAERKYFASLYGEWNNLLLMYFNK